MNVNDSEKTVYDSFVKTMRLHYKCNQKILEKKGLYAGQPALLFILMKNGLQSQKEIAKKLNVSAATINVMVKRLEKSGLVERVKDEEDLRVSRVMLTEEGKRVAGDAMESMKVIREEIFKNLTSEEEDNLNFLLNKINNSLMEVLDNKN